MPRGLSVVTYAPFRAATPRPTRSLERNRRAVVVQWSTGTGYRGQAPESAVRRVLAVLALALLGRMVDSRTPRGDEAVLYDLCAGKGEPRHRGLSRDLR